MGKTNASWLIPLALLAVVLLGGYTCGGGEDDTSEARHRSVSDGELACLTHYDRDRHCLGPDGVPPLEDACPREPIGVWFDTYGRGCVDAHIAEWDCLADLPCGESGCEAETAAIGPACTGETPDAG